MTQAGDLTPEQLALLFSHMPERLSVADEEDVVRFWVGDTFSWYSPKLIGRDLFAGHPKRAHAAMKSLLVDLKSGAKDQVDTIEHTSLGQERIIYTALRDAGGACCGVVETVLPVERVDRPGAE